MVRTSSSTDRRPARDRLLAAADELFYEEGVNLVGIDRVIELAGVADGVGSIDGGMNVSVNEQA
jgi:AcrR family transcriptional regulator